MKEGPWQLGKIIIFTVREPILQSIRRTSLKYHIMQKLASVKYIRIVRWYQNSMVGESTKSV